MLNLAYFPPTYRPNITFKNKIAQLFQALLKTEGISSGTKRNKCNTKVNN